MQFKFFTIPVENPTVAEEELNRFLRGHRVVSVHRDIVTNTNWPCWCYSVEYLEMAGANNPGTYESRNKPDYREVLTKEEFAKFRVLRECRKELATEDAVPAYAVFIDEQLAAMAKLKGITSENLKTISGVGDKKIEKYAERFIKQWNAKRNEVEQILPTARE